MKFSTPRYTTSEVARKIGCLRSAALQILKAAETPFSRLGSCYLWDATAVERLIATLRGRDRESGPDAGDNPDEA